MPSGSGYFSRAGPSCIFTRKDVRTACKIVAGRHGGLLQVQCMSSANVLTSQALSGNAKPGLLPCRQTWTPPSSRSGWATCGLSCSSSTLRPCQLTERRRRCRGRWWIRRGTCGTRWRKVGSGRALMRSPVCNLEDWGLTGNVGVWFKLPLHRSRQHGREVPRHKWPEVRAGSVRVGCPVAVCP